MFAQKQADQPTLWCQMSPSLRLTSCLLAIVMMAGCTSVPHNRGLELLNQELDDKSVKLSSPEARTKQRMLIQQWLSEPLSIATVRKIAVLQNPEMDVLYAELGLSQAERIEHTAWQNPKLSISRRDSDEPGSDDLIELGIFQNLSNLLLFSSRSRLADQTATIDRKHLANRVKQFAANVDQAFFAHAAAVSKRQVAQLIAKTADVNARLAQQFYRAGNISERELAELQATSAQAQLALLEQQAEIAATRTALNAVMSLPVEQSKWRLAHLLPEPVNTVDSIDKLLKTAQQSRLDLAAARMSLELAQSNDAVKRRYRLLGEVELGYLVEKDTDGSELKGPELSFELPIFDTGKSRVLNSQAQVELATARLQRLVAQVDSEVRLLHLKLLNLQQRLTIVREQLIPLRAKIVERDQARQNFMLIGQFELIAERAEHFDAYQQYFALLSDYWMTRSELAIASGARLASEDSIDWHSAGLSPTDYQNTSKASHHGRHGSAQRMTDHGSHSTSDLQNQEKQP